MRPEIDFTRIRPFNGGRDRAFEELSCQLAGLETVASGGVFHRKGTGADAGVECFLIRPDGGEVGWQAKYFFQFGPSQVKQLDESIGSALGKHPRLDTYVVCIPSDLRDGRSGTGMTELGRWERWAAGWTARAAASGRSLAVRLWNKSNFVERLSRADAQCVGRLVFWFDVEVLTRDWFEHRFRVTRAALGQRYTPETGVDVPTRQCLLAFARSRQSGDGLQGMRTSIEAHGHRLLGDLLQIAGAARAEKHATLKAAIDCLCGTLLACVLAPPDRQLPLDACAEVAAAAEAATLDVLRWLSELPEEAESLKARPAVRAKGQGAPDSVFRLLAAVRACRDLLREKRIALANPRRLLIYGAPGVGKSHLLAEAVEAHVGSGAPALLLLGASFVEGDPWRQVMEQLDLGHRSARELLGALDAAAEAAGTRAVLYVDAINERHGLDVWPTRLAAFLAEADPFPRVAIGVSCRTTYLDAFEGALPEPPVARLPHRGFGGTAGEAARRYLELRGIVRHGMPSFTEEFDNPLFLRTCCDLLDRMGRRDFPRGLQGVTAVFDFYVDAVTSAIEDRMHLDKRLKYPREVLDRLTEAMPDTGAMPYVEAHGIAEEVLRSGGVSDRSLLAALEHEGILSVEPAAGGGGEVVRFTFERLGDYRVAAGLIRRNLDPSDVMGSFAPGTRMGDLVRSGDRRRTAGVVEALAVLLPERTDFEILDVAGWPDGGGHIAERSFVESLTWREQGRFTQRAFRLLEQVAERRGDNALVLRTLLSLATEPSNAYNARYLDGMLRGCSMPDRDVLWSVPIAVLAEEDGNPLDTLVSWSAQDGFGPIEDERAELAATALAWMLSTSHRRLRDRATKALATLLAPRAALGAKLVRSFAALDDRYVVERVLVAVYGAALQGLDPAGVGDLAAAVCGSVFAGGYPVPHLLARDYASGIVEFAAHLGVLPSGAQISEARPPYRSSWPLETVTEEDMLAFREGSATGSYPDAIVFSAVNDGDFARYVVDGAVRHWGVSAPGAGPPPSADNQFEEWKEAFQARASPGQLKALETLLSLSRETGSFHDRKDAVDEADARFAELLSLAEREDYRLRGRAVSRSGKESDHRLSPSAARFDQGWARRWICRRAHELGWTAARFSGFERDWVRGHGRMEHRIERIGKKYQWIALNELLVRLADHLVFFDETWGDEPGRYEGPWQVLSRDIDPTLLLASTAGDGADVPEDCWWTPAHPELGVLTPRERLVWLSGSHDVVDGEPLIEVSAPDGGRFLVLNNFARWAYRAIGDGQNRMEQETWFRLSCVVVRQADEPALVSALAGRTLVSPSELPAYELPYRTFVGEHPWRRLAAERHGWMSIPRMRRGSLLVRRPTVDYLAETAGHDYSITENINIELPAAWLVDALSMRLESGRQPRYVDGTGRAVYFDPSVFLPGPSAGVVDRDLFLDVLEREGLKAVWVIAGEKGVFGGSGPPGSNMTFGGRRMQTSIYRMAGGTLHRTTHVEHQPPSAQQMKEFTDRT